MLDHVFISVSDIARSIAFYETALAPLGIAHVLDYDGKQGPAGHPDLKGFGANGRVFFWLRAGTVERGPGARPRRVQPRIRLQGMAALT